MNLLYAFGLRMTNEMVVMHSNTKKL